MPWELTGNSATNPANNFLGTADNQPLAMRTNKAERMRITTAGKVGIGTTNPGSNLTVDVPGVTTPISALSVDVQSFGTGPNAQVSHYFRVRDIGAAPPNGWTAFIIRGDGTVGIGTAQPGAKLEINNGDLLFKAAAEDPGDIIFQSASGGQKGGYGQTRQPEQDSSLVAATILHVSASLLLAPLVSGRQRLDRGSPLTSQVPPIQSAL